MAFKSSSPDRFVLLKWLFDQRPDFSWSLPCLINHIAELDVATAYQLFGQRFHLIPPTLHSSIPNSVLSALPQVVIRYLFHVEGFIDRDIVMKRNISNCNIPMLEFLTSACAIPWKNDYWFFAASREMITVLNWAKLTFPTLFLLMQIALYIPRNYNPSIEGLRWIIRNDFPITWDEISGMLRLQMIDELAVQLEKARYVDGLYPTQNYLRKNADLVMNAEDCEKMVDMMSWFFKPSLCLHLLSPQCRAHFVR